MPSPLQVTKQTFHGMPAIRVAGDLIFGNEVELLRKLAVQLSAEGGVGAILDLRAVTAVDSTALGAIVEFRRVLGGARAVYLLHPPERLRTYLTVTHLESLFIVVDNEDQLARHLSESANPC
jgi:anti-anti-sigma factor